MERQLTVSHPVDFNASGTISSPDIYLYFTSLHHRWYCLGSFWLACSNLLSIFTLITSSQFDFCRTKSKTTRPSSAISLWKFTKMALLQVIRVVLIICCIHTAGRYSHHRDPVALNSQIHYHTHLTEELQTNEMNYPPGY